MLFFTLIIYNYGKKWNYGYKKAIIKIEFRIIGFRHSPPKNIKSTAFLTWDNWNDYSFLTLFRLLFVDDKFEVHDIGSVKIGYFGQIEGERKLSVDETFESLDNTFFSVGQSDSYYVNLNKLGDNIRDFILNGLRDIAKDPALFNRAINEEVTKISLFRGVSIKSVTGQFRRLASGGARLTDYNFKFIAPPFKNHSSSYELDFNVNPESFPPTNIHVLIGRNGIGKTLLLNNMISTLINENTSKNESGKFESESESMTNDTGLFANLISISFSAFDESDPKPERKDNTKGIQYSYIGLKQIRGPNDKALGPKSTVMLKNEFFKSLNNCKLSSKKERWKKGIEMLETDPNFKELDIKTIIEIDNQEEFKSKAFSIFRELSSGHKIVLLTITRLIESLQEKSLVLIDEPEAHLHPPLLSAFIRALSELLTTSNAVAIIATHSPVILQEVPKSCAWRLRRSGEETKSERLSVLFP
jgi:predicted ATPase